MLYLVAIVFPPLALLLCGKPFQAMLCLPLCLFYFPSALWAILVVANHQADRRIDRLVDSAERSSKAVARSAVKAAKIQARANVKVAKIRAKTQPASPPIAREFEVEEDEDLVPSGPWFTGEKLAAIFVMAKQGVLSAKTESIRAYRNLPEWAQPITWGLAGGTLISIPIILFLIGRRWA